MKYQVGEAWQYGNTSSPYIIVDIKDGRYGVLVKGWTSAYYYDTFAVDCAMKTNKVKGKFNIKTLEPIQEMNKYNIEVGDYIKTAYGNGTITSIEGERVYYTAECGVKDWKNISNFPKDLISKANKMNKKIIGYKLLKDTPSLKADTVLKIDVDGVVRGFDKFGVRCKFNPDTMTQAEWFEPVYETKPTEVFVDTLAGKVKITKDKVSFNSSEYMYTIGVSRHLGIIARWKERSNEYYIQVETFKVGCKLFSIEDIKPLQEAIKQVTE